MRPIGTGIPTSSGQTAIPLPGMPTSGSSPYGFLLVDHNPAVAGVDTLYVGDDRTVVSGGGVQKWTSNGTMWTLVATFASGLTAGVRGVTGYVDTNGDVVVFATTGETPTRLVRYVDNFVNTNPPVTVLVTAPVNTVYRGVALAQH